MGVNGKGAADLEKIKLKHDLSTVSQVLADLLVSMGCVPAMTGLTPEGWSNLGSEVTQAFKDGKVRCVFEDGETGESATSFS